MPIAPIQAAPVAEVQTAPEPIADDRSEPVVAVPVNPEPVTQAVPDPTARAAAEAVPTSEVQRQPETGAFVDVPILEVEVAGPSVPTSGSVYPIDLPTSLRLADAENPTIGAARARIAEAGAKYQLTRAELLPNLNAGLNYDAHTGPLQRSSGEILSVNRQALYFGGGADSVAAETVGVPAISIVSHLADALYDPLAARQDLDRSRSEASATANETLLDVAMTYLDYQGARARLEARLRTVSEAERVAEINAQYARVGQGREADARRAETQWRLRQAEVREAEEQAAVASSKLAGRLHLDPALGLEPVGDPLAVYELVDLDTPIQSLLAAAIGRRPEVAAGSAAIAAAETRVRQEVARPFLPSLFLGLSGAAFGGGSNLVPPTFGNVRGRTDMDVGLFWTLQNFGLGNLAIQRRRRAERDEAGGAQARAIAQVRGEIAAALGDALTRRQQIGIAVGELATAEKGFLHDLELILEAVDRPIEVLNSLGLLQDAREAFIDAVIGYNQAQFRLFVALGSPPPLATPAAPAPASPSAAIMGDLAIAEPRSMAELKPAATDHAEAAEPKTPSPDPAIRLTGEPSGPVAGSANAEDRKPVPSAAASRMIDALAEAHKSAIAAALAYDRVESRLRSATSGIESKDDVMIADIQALARVHRGVIEAEIQFDRRRRELGLELLGEPIPEEPGSDD